MKFGFVLFLICLGQVNANAEDLCQNVRDCTEMGNRIAARLKQLQSDDPEFTYGANGERYSFIRDTSNPSLGNAWRDPSGTIWGDLVENPESSPRGMSWEEGDAYCKKIHARLPSREDFIRLTRYMGATAQDAVGRPPKYTPQLLPNLGYYLTSVPRGLERGPKLRDYLFWSSTSGADRDFGEGIYTLFSGGGHILVINPAQGGWIDDNEKDIRRVRCVQ